MIDFKNIKEVKRRVKKETVEEGDFYLLDISSKEGKDLAESAGDDAEKVVGIFLRALMCDDKGELLNLTDEELIEIPVGLMKDIVAAIKALIYGEKKS